jgi:hypothetical protein
LLCQSEYSRHSGAPSDGKEAPERIAVSFIGNIFAPLIRTHNVNPDGSISND